MKFDELAAKAGDAAARVGRQAHRPTLNQVMAAQRRRSLVAWSTTTAVLAAVVLGGVLTLPTADSQAPATASDPTTTTTPPTTTTLEDDTAAPALADVPETCPVTVPGDEAFTPASETPDELSPGDDLVWYGTPELWTKIQPNEQVRNRSWLSPGAKTFWWSENFPGGGVEGSPNITVTAEHLDGLAPTVKSGGPGTNGFHPDLGDFMLVGVELPGTGCWKLTAEYKGATLSYVMWVTEE